MFDEKKCRLKWKENTNRLPLSKCFGDESQKGMTLLEIIIVVALLGTLMGYLVTTLTDTADNARRDQAKIVMGQLTQALNQFKVDNFRYPTTEQGLSALMSDPGNAKNWRGPYTEPNRLKDPWGEEFDYQCADGRVFTITSGAGDLTLGTSDDIKYPEDEAASENP